MSGTTKRRPGQKPELTKVSLRPEEAVLGACNTTSVAGPGDPGGCDVLTRYDPGS